MITNVEFINCTPIPQFVIDQDHRTTHWNRAMEVLTGISACDIIGTRDQWQAFYPKYRPVLADLVVDKRLDDVINLYQNSKISKSEIIPYAWEATDFFKNINGHDRHLYFLAAPVKNSDGQITGAIETVQDISQRVKAGNELRESQERYRLLTEQVADGVVVIQDRKICFANDAFAHLFEHKAAKDLVGLRTISLISPQYRQAYMAMYIDFDEKGIVPDKVMEWRCVRSKGTEFWIEASNNLISWNGEPAMLATVRDITDRKYRELSNREETLKLKEENIRLKSQLKNPKGLGLMIGRSRPMQDVYETIIKAASSNANVVVYGESGTGKELVARTIHALSDRESMPFIAVNCGAIPENLFESEFFGYKKGAFSGATIDKMGLLEGANGGYLFLDEVGEIPLNMQVKLLRVIDSGGFTPIGSTRIRHSDARIIAATNKNLRDLVKEGLIREDFFYRIHVVPVHLPPLRVRMDDLPLLVDHFMNTMSDSGTDVIMPDHILKTMQNYHWPGNVRELQNAIQRYLTFNRFDITEENNLSNYNNPKCNLLSAPEIDEKFRLSSALENYEKNILVKAMHQEQGNRTRAAMLLGIERRSLQRKLQRFQIAD